MLCKYSADFYKNRIRYSGSVIGLACILNNALLLIVMWLDFQLSFFDIVVFSPKMRLVPVLITQFQVLVQCICRSSAVMCYDLRSAMEKSFLKREKP